jgi:hypothetical protein
MPALDAFAEVRLGELTLDYFLQPAIMDAEDLCRHVEQQVDLQSVRCRLNVELRTAGLRLIVHERREYWCFRVELFLLQHLCSSAAKPACQLSDLPRAICQPFQTFT